MYLDVIIRPDLMQTIFNHGTGLKCSLEKHIPDNMLEFTLVHSDIQINTLIKNTHPQGAFNNVRKEQAGASISSEA